MAFPDLPRKRVSRETRLLLTTVSLSLLALWVLARIRFPEQARTGNPVAPLLTQLAPGTGFEDLERAVFELEPKLASVLQVISVQPSGSSGILGGDVQSVPSFRLRDDAVVALIDAPAGSSIADGMLVAHDPATGLALLRTGNSETLPIRTWTPESLDYPPYLLVSDVSQGRVSLRPVFVGRLLPAADSAWGGFVWRISSANTIPNGAFMFTTSGAFAGLIVGQPKSPAIVPATTVLSLAERLLEEGQRAAGWLGIEVQPLTPQIRAATGLTSGAVVTWVDSQSPAAGKIVATDIIQAADDHVMQTKADWDTYTARLAARDVVTLRFWRRGRTEQLQVTALEPGKAAASSRLGLTMRAKPGVGVEVLHVEAGSAAMRAGIAVDDVLTRVGDIEAPTPAQITRTFAAASKDGALLLAITRRTGRLVVALVK